MPASLDHLTDGVDLDLLIAVEFAEPAVVPIHRLHCADLILGQALGYEPITANRHTLQRNWHMLLTNPEEAARADHEVLLAVRPFHNALDIAKLIALRVIEIQPVDLGDSKGLCRRNCPSGLRATVCRASGLLLGCRSLSGGVGPALLALGHCLHPNLGLALRLVDHNLRLRAFVADVRLALALDLDVRSAGVLLNRNLRPRRLDVHLRLLLRLNHLDLSLRLVHLNLRLSHCDIDVRPRHADDDLRLRDVHSHGRLRLTHQDLGLRLTHADLRLRLLNRDLRRGLIDAYRRRGLLDHDSRGVRRALPFSARLTLATGRLRRLIRRQSTAQLLGHLQVLAQGRQGLLRKLLQLRRFGQTGRTRRPFPRAP